MQLLQLFPSLSLLLSLVHSLTLTSSPCGNLLFIGTRGSQWGRVRKELENDTEILEVPVEMERTGSPFLTISFAASAVCQSVGEAQSAAF